MIRIEAGDGYIMIHEMVGKDVANSVLITREMLPDVLYDLGEAILKMDGHAPVKIPEQDVPF